MPESIPGIKNFSGSCENKVLFGIIVNITSNVSKVFLTERSHPLKY